MAPRVTLSQAFEGMIFEKRAAGKSKYTIADYRVTLKKLQQFLEASPGADPDPPLASFTRDQLVVFFVWLRDEHVSEPGGVAPRGRLRLSHKTRRNIHTNLSALWTWAVANGFVERNIVRTIEAPKADDPEIRSYTIDEVERMIKACDKSRDWRSRNGTAHRRRTAERDRLIVRLLLDTGLRAQELCDIAIGDINMSAGSIRVRGKGDKARTVQFGRRTARALWAYLTPRLPAARPDDPLFVAMHYRDPRPLNRYALFLLIQRLGRRAGVPGATVHRFRHTFATMYLRNGGNPAALRDLLGHSDMEMVMRYVHFIQADYAADHARASPVDHLRI